MWLQKLPIAYTDLGRQTSEVQLYGSKTKGIFGGQLTLGDNALRVISKTNLESLITTTVNPILSPLPPNKPSLFRGRKLKRTPTLSLF